MVALRETDIVIVGAGPSGCAAAIHLRRQGLRVAVLEKAAFPRHKVCGDFLTPGAVGALRDLGAAGLHGVAGLEALGPARLSGMRITYEGRDVLADYAGGHEGWSLGRRDLDACLARAAAQAGAEVIHGARAMRCARGPDGVMSLEAIDPDGGTSTWRAKLLVDAAGRFSPLASARGWRRPDQGLERYAIWSHMTGVRGLGARGEMHVFQGGYVGVAPLGEAGAANVTMVVTPRRWMAARRDPSGYAGAVLREHPELGPRLRAARVATPVRGLGPLACHSATMGRDGIALVGDAGGFIDPFTGEGIFVALSSAAMLAAAVRAHGLDSPEALRSYDRQYGAAFAAKFRLCRLLQRVISRPWLAAGVARGLAGRRDLANRMVAATGDIAPAASVLSVGYLASLGRAALRPPGGDSGIGTPREAPR